MLTAYAVGELEGAELEQFEAWLQDPVARKELEGTEDMISLLTDSFEDEVKSALSLAGEDHSLMDFALGELDDQSRDEVAVLLAESDEAKAELEGIEDMVGLLSRSLEGEWRSRESYELDVPAFTDFVLGELDEEGSAEFKTILKYSENARKELGETEELVSLLSEGLESEWKSELSATDYEFSLVEATGEENVVSVNFAQASQGSSRSARNRGPVLVSLAAVLAGLLVVGGMLSESRSGQNMGFSSDDHVWFDDGDRAVEIAEVPVESPFNLRLLEEVNQPVDLELEMVDLGAFDPYSSEDVGGMVKVSFEENWGPVEFPLQAATYHPAGHFFYTGTDSNDIYDTGVTYPEVGFNIDPYAAPVSQDDIGEELRSIVLEMDNPNVDVKALQSRLEELLEVHKSIGVTN